MFVQGYGGPLVPEFRPFGLHQTDVTVQLSQCAIDIDNICRYRYVMLIIFKVVQTTNKQIDHDRPKECGKTPKAPCSEETVPKTSLVPLASKAGMLELLGANSERIPVE